MTQPRILIYDVESAPLLSYVWRLWNIDHVVALKDDWYLLSVAWKWLGEREVHCVALDDCERRHPEDDLGLAQVLRDLFDEADIVIAHNGNTFDQPKARTRMWVHGLEPPSPFKEIDTLKVARNQFAFSSNTLDDLCMALGIGRKVQTGGFSLWLRCMADDPVAWARMKRYNKSDVRLLEKLYLRMRPWMPRHPNLGIYEDDEKCPRCGKGPLVRQGFRHYGVTQRQRFQCGACGGWCQGRAVIKSGVSYTV